MKFFIVLAIIAVGAVHALTDEQKAKLAKASGECKAQTGVSQDLIEKARRGEIVDDPKLREHLLCFSKKIGTVNEAGDIQADVIKTKLRTVVTDDAEVNRITDKCLIKKSTPQDTVWEAAKCLKQAKPEFNLNQ